LGAIYVDHPEIPVISVSHDIFEISSVNDLHPIRRNLWIRDVFQIKKIGKLKIGFLLGLEFDLNKKR
jgi:hypothetical protein